MHARGSIIVLLALAGAGAATAAQGSFPRKDADAFQAKLVQIVEYGNRAPAKGAAAPAPRSTRITDTEVNAYLQHHAGDQIPVGVMEPSLTAIGDGRVSGRAVVDLDVVRKSKARGWLDPMGYLTGRMPITAAGRLTTSDGVGRFHLESAEVSGVAIPKTVLQELLSFYSRTAENPAGINMDDPFELPSRIREIRVGTGTATIVQ